MKFILTKTEVILENYTKEEYQEIKQLLSYTPISAKYIKRKYFNWNPIVSFLKKDRFPRGLFHLIKDKFPDIPITFLYEPKDPFKPVSLNNITLRDYQMKSLKAFQDHHRGIIKLATRSGKTVVAIACAQSLHKKTLFIVNSKSLLDQAYQEFSSKLNIPIGIIGDGKCEIENTTIGTIQTLYSYYKKQDLKTLSYLKEVEFLIFDEVHHSSDSYLKISAFATNAYYRLGLSATPCMSNEENTFKTLAITGPIIYTIDMGKLVEDKRIVKPHVKFIEYHQGKQETKFTDWTTLHWDYIVHNKIRNMIILLLSIKESKKNKSILILVERREHGKLLEKLISTKLPCKFIEGLHTIENRINFLEALESKKIKALITTKIFNEGKDIPFLDTVIIASGGKSAVTQTQRYGRPMTAHKLKDKAVIYDFIDGNHVILHKHSQKRLKLVQSNSAFDVETIKFEDIKNL